MKLYKVGIVVAAFIAIVIFFAVLVITSDRRQPLPVVGDLEVTAIVQEAISDKVAMVPTTSNTLASFPASIPTTYTAPTFAIKPSSTAYPTPTLIPSLTTVPSAKAPTAVPQVKSTSIPSRPQQPAAPTSAPVLTQCQMKITAQERVIENLVKYYNETLTYQKSVNYAMYDKYGAFIGFWDYVGFVQWYSLKMDTEKATLTNIKNGCGQ